MSNIKALVLDNHEEKLWGTRREGTCDRFVSLNAAFKACKNPKHIFLSLDQVIDLVERIHTQELSPTAALLNLDPDKPSGY